MNDNIPLRLLVVEDDLDTRDNLVDVLALDGHRVETAGTAAEALAPREWDELDAIVLDWRLPDGSAEHLLSRLAESAPQAAVVIITGHADIEGTITALRRGAWDYLLKPVNADALRASLQRVAERKRLAQTDAQSEAAFRTLVEAADCLILILQPDGTITYFSPFAEEVTGYPAGEVLRRKFHEVFPPNEPPPESSRSTAPPMAGCPIAGREYPVGCRDGSRRWVLWSTRPLPGGAGDGLLLAVGQDLTERKRAEERLLESERLAAVGQMVTGLAHESRNALQRGQACLEVLALELADRPESLELLAGLQRAQDHLHRLYEEVRGYAAPIDLHKQPCEMGTLLRGAWGHLEPLRRTKDVRLTEEDADGMNLTCPVDPDTLGQVLRHVLENAITACPEPGMVTAAYRSGSLDGQPALEVVIRDNGPGLSPEQQARAFEPFYTTKTKGTGLGMAVAKRVVEAHGGRIRIGNATSGGAEVRITLPCGG